MLSKVGSGNSNMWKERKVNLPAAGYRYYTTGSQFNHTGSRGYVWSSSQHGSFNAGELSVSSSSGNRVSAKRSYGQPV
ncbi:hypothetical protein ACQ1PY_10840, partial [Ornithobacterium rhinotracheale]